MIRKRNDNKRRFSYTEPILYRGEAYPSTKVYMDNGSGMAEDGTMFVDKDGQYYSMGKDGNAYPTLLQHDLPEVEVKPSQEEMLSRSLRNSLTLSQDKARVSNPLNPYESFNNHLRERALRGAREHGLWDKQHPNLSAWRDFGTAIPFGIASIPLVGGLGETALGQAAINGIGNIMAKSAVKTMDSALGLGFGAKGAYDISQGDVTPSTLLELTGIYPGIKAARGLVSSKKITREPFVSELDWSPESWFRHRATGKYDEKDVASLKSHIPEYHKIEQQTKANGTWLQMPDGTTWEGDPRGWVMYKSKNVRDNYMDEVLSHGENVYFGPDKVNFNTDAKGNDISGEVLGTKPIWTSTNPKIGATYGDDVFHIVIPKDTNIRTVADAQGRNWNEVLPGKITDDLVYPNLTDDNVIRINNVVDPGSHISILKLAKEAPANETVPDFLKRTYIGDDLVLGKNVRRKSLYGNNGNFDLNNPDIYKGLIPLIFGTPTAFSFNQTDK